MRLGGDASACSILSETILENILDQAAAVKPDLLVIDSIQTIYSDALESSAGSVSQVRECAARLLRYAKETGTPVILIGHITKDGTIAGTAVSSSARSKMRCKLSFLLIKKLIFVCLSLVALGLCREQAFL